MASEQQARLADARAEGQAEADRWADATRDIIDSTKTTASNAADSVKETAGSIKDGTCEAAGAVTDSIKETGSNAADWGSEKADLIKETGSNAAQWGREKTDSMKESINDVKFRAQEEKEYTAGFIEQSGETVKQAFFDADESMKQSMQTDTGIPGTTSLGRTNTPSFDDFC
ncbi:uncharacterized protein LOC144547973 [Carex rostrata]